MTVRPHSSRPDEQHKELIDAMGGPTSVAYIISARIGKEPPLKPQTVSMWRLRGIPYRYRGPLAVEARERNIPTPSDFFGVGS